MPNPLKNRLILRRSATIAVGASVVMAGAATLPAAASASPTQIAMFQDFSDLVSPAATLQQFRLLGATTVRVSLPWAQIAPGRKASRKPKFNATDPNAYPAAGWQPYDAIVREAQRDGLTVDFIITGGAPRWAEGSGIPRQARIDSFYAWKPNARDYGQFASAVGKRYDGRFKPPGQSTLPAVHFWALFNEPNFGENLGPQAIHGSRVSVAPMMYRSLVDQGWKALHATGHGRDTILIGEFAAEGVGPGRPTRKAPQGYPGNFGQTKPLQFIRTLYCLDSRYRELRGGAARSVGCPTTGGGSRRFRTQHPGLFAASGVADHPYPAGNSPVQDERHDPDFAEFADLGRLARMLDRVDRVYGSHQRFPIYNTEYGYITRPPKGRPYVSQATAAYYINWAEYLSWKNPRIKSYMQYLLTDPPPNLGAYSGFASGLETFDGKPKATYAAYRLPFYMPRTSFSHTQSVQVWGDVRPAPFATLDGFGPQKVLIEENIGGAWRTLNTVPLTSREGYVDLKMKFPSSGQVRLQWTYPSGDSFLPGSESGQTVTSRIFAIKVH